MRSLDIMRNADRDRFYFEFCPLSGEEGSLDAEIRSLGGVIHHCRLNLGFQRAFSKLLASRDFNVVHSHVHYTSGLFLRLASKAGVPVRIAHFRTTDDGRGNSPRRRAQRRLMRHWIDQYATAILGVSEEALRAGWGNDWHLDPRCEVVRNGIDPGPFAASIGIAAVRETLGVGSADPLCIHVGSFSPDKNHVRLLEIFAELHHRAPNAALMLVGGRGPSLEERTREQARQLGLQDSVVFTGERDDVPRLLKAAYVLIFPSLREGSPGAVLEAIAAGIATVASDLASIREIRRFASSLVLQSLANSDEEWALSILEAWRRSKRPDALPIDLALFWEEFDAAETARKHEAIWEGHQQISR